MKCVFVTVGSTRFDSLVAAVFTNEVVAQLVASGFTDLVIQAGDSPLPPNFRERADSLRVSAWTYKPSLQEEIATSDLIISHGGSGTIIEVLRAKKHLLVVPNPTLLDDHQKELAEALSSMNYLKTVTTEGLARAIRTFDYGQTIPFPEPAQHKLQTLLDDIMGF